MSKLIPLEGKEGNCCPKCFSKRVTRSEQCVVYKTFNLNSGKEIEIDSSDRIISNRLSNRDKAFKYDHAGGDSVGMTMFHCRNCGWNSDPFIE